MTYLTRAASPALAGIVERLWCVHDPQPSFEPETICPDGSPELVIHLGDAMRHQPRYLLVGQMTGPLTVVPSGGVHMVGARLTPAGLHRLLPMRQDVLVDRVVALDSVWSAWTRRTADQVSDARTPHAALDGFEHAIDALVRGTSRPSADGPVDRAIRVLRARAGNASIGRLAAAAGVSRRHFERCFRDRVGLPPRLYARIVRFQGVFQALGTESGAALAARYGYADQAHLVREVRRFAGTTPSILAAADGLTTFFRQ